MNVILKRFLPHLGAIAIFALVSAFYFSPQLSGKVMQQSDIISVRSMSKEMDDYRAKTGKQALWTNAMFGGMPTYQINSIRDGNQTGVFDNIAQLFIARPIGRFISAMLSFYLLMMVMGVPFWAGVFGAITFGLTTNNLILFEAGHTSKLGAIAYLPLMAAGILMAFRKQYIPGATVFGIGVALELFANHIQMTYYLVLTLLFFGVARLVYDIQQKQLLHFAKAAGVLIFSGLLGLGTATSNLLPTYEYSKDTMRGDGILPKAASTAAAPQAPDVQGAKGGLAYDYAMQWSNNTLDVMAALIPGVAGGGSQEPVGQDSKTLTDLRSKGYNVPGTFKLPLYWGGLPFTSGPAYLGAIVLFLFGMGVVLIKDPVKWWLALGVLLTVLLSMGKHFGAINHFFFDYVPLYNKFRSPSSILSVTAFLAPALGFLAVAKMVDPATDRKKIMRALQIVGGILGVITLFYAIMGSSFYSFTSDSDPRLQQQGMDLASIIADRKSKMSSDAWRSFLLIALCAGLVWAWATERINKNILLVGIGLLAFFDTWTVGRRYVNSENFVTKNNYQSNFAPRPVDEQILTDKSLSYRVHDLTIDAFQSAQASYFHKTVGGYNPAKLQRFNDIIDRYLIKGNQNVFDMLNTKYFIVPGQGGEGGQPAQPLVQLNPRALGNAWFVNMITLVKTPLEEINALDSLQPRVQVVINQEFLPYIKGLSLVSDSTASIKLTRYDPQSLTYSSIAKTEQFAVFSEVWYGPNKGWQAYVDGKPVDHIRVNYLLRGMKIPAGNHTIEFKFDPKSYETGKMVSGISSIALFALLGVVIGTSVWNVIKNPPVDDTPAPAAPKPQPKPVAPPVKPADKPATAVRKPQDSRKGKKK
jgi:hypothetical protein